MDREGRSTLSSFQRVQEFLAQHQGLADRIRDHIREGGAVSTASFRDVKDRIQWWWDNDDSTSTTQRWADDRTISRSPNAWWGCWSGAWQHSAIGRAMCL